MAKLRLLIMLACTAYHYGHAASLFSVSQISSKTGELAIDLANVPDTEAPDSSLMIRATLRNSSSSALVLKVYSPYREYYLFRVVLMADGKEVNKTRFQRMLTDHQRGPGSIDYLTIRPGESIDFQIDLIKLYDITKPGTYSATASLFNDATTTSPASSAPINVQISTKKLDMLSRKKTKEMIVAN